MSNEADTINGHSVYCPECGMDNRWWRTESFRNIENGFERQYGEKTFKEHIDHGTLTIVSELKGADDEQADVWKKQLVK